MKIERLRKSHRKEIIIGGLIALSIISAITFVTTRAKYRVTQELKLAKGTINYKVPDFKMVAMYKSEDGTNYTEINEMPTSGYVVNQDKSYCTVDGTTQVKNKLYTNSSGEHIFKSLKKNDKCYVWFDIKLPSASETIIANLETSVKEQTTTEPNFVNSATTNEGVYKTEDKMYGGDTYYWRGAVTNNHVIFANKCWRIIRINGDGTTRLIYNGTPSGTVPNQTCPGNGANIESIAVANQAYNSNYNRSEYVGWTYSINTRRTLAGTDSNIKTRTETWYTNNLKDYKDNIADGKFCNDRDTGAGYSWSSTPSDSFYYAGYDRSGAKSVSTVNPTIDCPNGDIYTLKVGAITMDEVVMAGGKWNTGNDKYYLYNSAYYWTMSPCYWNGWGSTGDAYVFAVYDNGQLKASSRVNSSYGIRPVINLRSDTTFSSGDGTQNTPYVVS